ncbi:hypothetical protein BKA56DRAFT_605028 [Ilyonectria sp. MPI-CAGE-AT-0026]|nr:hypothetical protein BKA56DRAFT_605028 [Ilyonectria sp. MPI-CAGE-AT-0026]
MTALWPSCAVSCLEHVCGSECSFSDRSSVCSDAALSSSVSVCFGSQCGVKDALLATRLLSVSCGISERNVSTTVLICCTLGCCLALAAVILRLITRLSRQGGGWMVDDLITALATVFIIPISGVIIAAVKTGLGRDIWMLEPEEITEFLKLYYFAELLYPLCLYPSKAAFLFFYLRIFWSQTFRRITYGTIVFTCAAGLSSTIVNIFQCRPVSYAWTGWDGEHTGHCMNMNYQAWSNAGISIALDFWIIGLPISQIASLTWHWRRKAEAFLMFGIGLFITIVSIIRLRYLVFYQRTVNPTWDLVPLTNWSLVEVDVGVICACMPALRILITRVLPDLLTSSDSNRRPAPTGPPMP